MNRMVEMTRILVWLTCFFWESKGERQASQLYHPGFRRWRHKKNVLCRWLFTFHPSWAVLGECDEGWGPSPRKMHIQKFSEALGGSQTQRSLFVGPGSRNPSCLGCHVCGSMTAAQMRILTSSLVQMQWFPKKGLLPIFTWCYWPFSRRVQVWSSFHSGRDGLSTSFLLYQRECVGKKNKNTADLKHTKQTNVQMIRKQPPPYAFETDSSFFTILPCWSCTLVTYFSFETHTWASTAVRSCSVIHQGQTRVWVRPTGYCLN